MTRKESSTYLQAKLRASGCDDPRELIPDELIDDLHAESGGWPGKLDALAMALVEGEEQVQANQRTQDSSQIQGAPESAEQIRAAPESPEQMQAAPESPEQIQAAPESAEQIQPASESPGQIQAEPDLPLLEAVVEPVERPDIQRLFLTLNRETLREIDLTESKTLVGRSELCDVTIDSRFVSKHHALLVRTAKALYLLDLNSTNGTFVNSQRIQSKPLRHDDVISIGNHGIKLICPAYRARPAMESLDLTETSTLRTLTDLRRSGDEDDQQTPPIETGRR